MSTEKSQSQATDAASQKTKTGFNFSEAVLSWFDQHGRKNLPWQQDINPYRVWVSEIMLQQTQVATVIPYFERFMDSLPTVADLAATEEDQVLHLWTGLGYYARARNLHKSAKIICSEHNGELPNQLDGLMELPGVGRSTAGAILSMGQNQYGVILDGNVKRVLARFYAVPGWPGKSQVMNTLWAHAEDLTPEEHTNHYNQAMMDLGATLCTKKNPECERCPLVSNCQVFLQQRINEFPGAKPKKRTPVKEAALLILQDQNGHVLLNKRPSPGIWGGLWSLPQAENLDQLQADLSSFGSLAVDAEQPLDVRRHTFSHYHFDMNIFAGTLGDKTAAVHEAERWHWFNPSAPTELGLAAPIKTLLTELANGELDL